MLKRSAVLWSLLALAGCEASTAPNERDSLEQARARWAQLGSDSYTVEMTRGCFCVLAGKRMTVTVRNGSVSSAEFFDSGGAVAGADLYYLPTVADLFDQISEALDRQPASFGVTYDELYGYPVRIDIDPSATVSDDEISYSLRDLTLLAALGAGR